MSAPSAKRPAIFVAIDRLDRRRHTFGLLLEHLVAALRDEAPDLDLTLVRHPLRTDLHVEGVREIAIPRALDRTVVYSRLFPLWAAHEGAGLVHFPFLFAPATWAGTALKRVVTIHGASRAALDASLVARFAPDDLARTRRRLAAFDRVVTVSESARREVVDHYALDPDRVRVIYNGVGDGFGPDATDEATLAKYGIRRPYVLTVSTLKPKKNVAAAVHAFARLVERHQSLDHQLVLVGYKAAGYTAVDDAIREHRLESRVVEAGWTESFEIPAFYASADALLFPTLHEGFGLPVVEAMASGVPVAASGVFSVPEVGGDAIVTFDPHDAEAMAAALEQVVLDEPLRARLREAGRARARRFTWREAARRTAAVYRELLET